MKTSIKNVTNVTATNEVANKGVNAKGITSAIELQRKKEIEIETVEAVERVTQSTEKRLTKHFDHVDRLKNDAEYKALNDAKVKAFAEIELRFTKVNNEGVKAIPTTSFIRMQYTIETLTSRFSELKGHELVKLLSAQMNVEDKGIFKLYSQLKNAEIGTPIQKTVAQMLGKNEFPTKEQFISAMPFKVAYSINDGAKALRTFNPDLQRAEKVEKQNKAEAKK